MMNLTLRIETLRMLYHVNKVKFVIKTIRSFFTESRMKVYTKSLRRIKKIVWFLVLLIKL